MSNCQQHKQPLHLICLELNCKDKRRACYDCVGPYHNNHDVQVLNKALKPLNYLNKNSRKREANDISLKLKNSITQIKKEVKNLFDICTRFLECENIVSNILIKLKTLSDTFSDKKLDRTWQQLQKSKEKSGQLVQGIYQKFRFLSDPKFDNHEQVAKGIVNISQKTLQSLKYIHNQLAGTMTSFKEIQNINFDNFDKFCIETKTNGVQNQNFEASKMFVEAQNEGVRIKKSQDSQTSFQMMQEVSKYKIQSDNQEQQRQKQDLLQQFKKKMVFEIYGSKNSVIQGNHEKPGYNDNQNIRIQITQQSMKLVPKFGVEISEKIIKQTLNKCSKSLENIYIAGLNQFSTECLKIVCEKFNSIKKLSYIYRIEADPIKLQMRQIFQDQFYKFREQALPVTQEIFNLYGKLPQLENMLIGDIQKFSNFEIKNLQIKFLTLGNFIQDKVLRIPQSLQLQINNKFTKLQRLSFFNIQSLPIQFVRNIIAKNPDLKYLWMSQCKNLPPQFFIEMQNTTLQVLILDIIDIQQTLCVPATIKSLIIDNCNVKKEIYGLKIVKNLKNFSISQSKLEIENLLTSILQQLQFSSRQTLQYLSLGNQLGLNDENSQILSQLVALKYLSVSFTDIRMKKFTKHKWGKNNKIEKLDIILPSLSFPESAVVEIGQVFPNLTHLICTFKKQITQNSFRNYKKLKVLRIKASTRTLNMNQSKLFLQKMKSKGVKITIID